MQSVDSPLPRSTFSLSVLVALAFLGGFTPASAASPGLSVSPEGVVISTEPGGRLAVFGVMRRAQGVVLGFERWSEIVEDEDGDGRVEVALEQASDPEWAQWIAVDLGSGAWALGGRSALAEPSRPVSTDRELAAGSSLWLVPEGIVEVLVVRPGAGEDAGAWSGEVWDGGSADGDGEADGVAGVALRGLSPVGESGPAPESYEAGDVLIAITPRALRYGVTEVVAGAGEVVQ